MRFLVISSPHGYTTRDVWKRVLVGLEANGQEVYPFDLLTRWTAYDIMLDLARKAKINLPEPFQSNLLAYEPIFGAAHFHEVDAVIVVSPQYFPVPIADLLRKSGIKTIAYFTECPYEDFLIAPVQAAHFDLTIVNDRYSLGLYESFCDNVMYLPHSYDPAIHYPGAEQNDGKVVWVGTVYGSRRAFLQAVDWQGIDLQMWGIWNRLPSRSRLRPHVRGDLLENEAVADLYRRAAMSFNIHRSQRYVDVDWTIDDGEAYSAGPRAFELAGCGCFQISDFRQEVVDIFGDTVPIYQTPAEFERLMRRALDDPTWREEVAKQQHQAVQGHDCAARMATLLERVA
jgi:hypothetical protein